MTSGHRATAPMIAPEVRSDERGFALIPVLLVLALLGVIGAEFAFTMRLEAAMAGAYRDGVIAAHLAEAGAEQAIREILSDYRLIGMAADQPLTFLRSPQVALPRLPRESVRLGHGRFSYRITDEESRINVNTAVDGLLHRLLASVGLEKGERDTIVDSIQDWKDRNDEHRASGAESDDTYLKRPVPYRSRNGDFQDTSELLQVNGITPAVYHGRDGRPALKDYVTVRGRGLININSASEVVLRALGLSAAEISEIMQTRRVTPYATVPSKFAFRNFGTTTRTFRIEAQARVDGGLSAYLVAVIQKTSASAVTVLSWRPQAEPPAGPTAP